MMNPAKMLSLACVSFIALAGARAQDTLYLRGRVRSVAGAPIEGVEVRIEGSRLVTRSDRAGDFVFVKAPKGPQLLYLRLLGYLPATVEARVPSVDPVEVSMLPTPRYLDTVKVVASVNVLAGVVVDDKDRPVPEATVEMLAGTSTTATTDSSGWFTFTSVKSGSLLVRARKLGFAPFTGSISLDDWRGLVIHLEPLDLSLTAPRIAELSGFGNTSTFVWHETQARLSQRGLRAIIVPREELAPYDDYPLGQAIVRTKTGAQETSDLNAVGNGVCVLLNGGRTVGPTPLNSYRTEDVEFVELYPPGTEASGTVGRYLRNAGCRHVQVPGTFTVGVYYAVVWLRT